MKNGTAPKHLSKEARDWWRKLAREYAISDEAGLLLLQTALEAFDRMRQAQNRLDAEGLTLTDRFGQQKPHPLTVVERDSRGQMLSSLRQLNLDLDPVLREQRRLLGSACG